MKKIILALTAIAVVGGSSLALTRTTEADECGPCDPSRCTPCEVCPGK